MWISKKKWDSVNKRISALEQAEQERIDRKKRLEECDDEILKKAEKIINDCLSK